MIVSKLSRSRNLVYCNTWLQRLKQNDSSSKVDLWVFMNRAFISSSQCLSRSTPTLAQLNLGLSTANTVPNGSTTGALINDELWPNLLFTDDTWSEVDESGDERFNRLANNTAWDSTENDSIPMRNSPFQLIFTPKHRVNIVKVISEELDLDRKQADIYLNFLRIRPAARKYDELRFIRERRNLLRLLKRHLSKKDIIEAYELFTLSLQAAQFRISFLNECGFSSLKPCHLLNFDKIQLLSEATLKHMRLLDPNINVVDCLLSQVANLTENESSQLQADLNIQGLTLKQQYEKIISFALEKAGTTAEIWKCKQQTRYLSIRGINILSKALADYSLTDSYSPSDMKLLFAADPNNLEEIITQIPKHFDENTLMILLKYPKILHTYSITLLDNLYLLQKDLGFTNAEIDAYPDCLLIETNDLKERINNLYSMFGVGFISQSRSILSLVHLDIPEILSLVKEMKNNGFPVTDISSVYEYHMIMVKKVAFHPKTVPAHLRGLNRELGLPQSIIISTLHRHPNFHATDNHKIKQTYQYLQNLEGITQEQLINGLNLCLYDIEKIKEAVNLMRERDDYNEWRKHPYFLEALIYTIEKTYSFDDVLSNDDQEAIINDIIDDIER